MKNPGLRETSKFLGPEIIDSRLSKARKKLIKG